MMLSLTTEEFDAVRTGQSEYLKVIIYVFDICNIYVNRLVVPNQVKKLTVDKP